MANTFSVGPIQLTERDIENLDTSGLTPLAREILSKSKVREFSDLASPDTEVANKAARSLARKCFKLIS